MCHSSNNRLIREFVCWSRYGEDPFVIAQVGVTTTKVMQAENHGVRKTATTTRHYMGYHKTNTMPTPMMTVSERDLYDSYFPGYEAMQTQGGADGIMCGFGSFDGTPSCANKRLLQKVLRDDWRSDAVIQSDCCDSLTSIKSQHNYTATYEEAIAAGFDAGLSLCFGCDPNIDHGKPICARPGQQTFSQKLSLKSHSLCSCWLRGLSEVGPSGNASNYLRSALRAGLVKPEQLRLAVARIMLTRFRLGEFDELEGGRLPWEVDEGLIDSTTHRALAREAAAASVVLAINRCNKETGRCTLPVATSGANAVGTNPVSLTGKSIAVLGPFANCSDTVSGGWSKTNCYLHSCVCFNRPATLFLSRVAH